MTILRQHRWKQLVSMLYPRLLNKVTVEQTPAFLTAERGQVVESWANLSALI